MSFSSECLNYIVTHSCTKSEETGVLDLLRKYLPINSSSIDWSRVDKKIEVDDVDRKRLIYELKCISTSMGATMTDIFYVINMDDAVPALKTSLSDWLIFVGELDFVDTIFISESMKIVFHWDFYKNLHATTL
jgi:hypothetical protein